MKQRDLIKSEYRYQESEDFYEMAYEWIDHNEPGKAEECLKHAIKLNENFIYAYITLAELYGKQKRWHESISVLKKAHKIDPQFDRLLFLISVYASDAGDYITSVRYITKAIQMNPDREYLQFRDQVREQMNAAQP